MCVCVCVCVFVSVRVPKTDHYITFAFTWGFRPIQACTFVRPASYEASLSESLCRLTGVVWNTHGFAISDSVTWNTLPMIVCNLLQTWLVFCRWLQCYFSLFAGQREKHPSRNRLSDGWSAGVVVCLERSANDLHMGQLIPLPPHHLFLRYNPEWLCLSGTGLLRLSWTRGC